MKTQINQLIHKASALISKKMLVAVCAATFVTASAFASGEETNTKAASALKKEFSNAENVQWKVTENYIKASFKWNDQKLEVFYNEDGETIAESRLIKLNNLPLRAQQYIDKKYHDYTIAEAIEYNSEATGLCYYVSVVKEGAKIILEITTEGGVSVYKP